MENNKFERTFKSDMFSVKPVINESLNFIMSVIPNISENNKFELKLIFSELLFNSVIHGNGLDGIRNVNIIIEVKGNSIYASVSDEGNGYDYNRLIDKFDSDEDLMEENGRGIKLVYALTDGIEFNAEGNSITFCKKVYRNG